MPTRHGPIDLILLTADGDVVLVEVNLWRNPQARREVVAQSLDYAACLFEMGYEEFEQAVLKGHHGERPKPSKLVDLFPDAERSLEATFVDAVATTCVGAASWSSWWVTAFAPKRSA